jgi:hypothetical protein
MGFRPLASGQGTRTGRDRRSGEANERDVRPKAENAQLLDLLSYFGPEFCFSTRAKILSETRLNTPSPRYNEKTNVADKKTMKTGMIFAVTLSVQLLLGAIPSFGQSNGPTVGVLKRDTTVSTVLNADNNRNQEGISKGADADRDYVSQIRDQAAQHAGNTVLATNGAPIELDNLEWTGQYAERFLRIPEGNSGKPKLVRFLIPVYREKSTKPEASVGTEDKQEQDRRVTEISSTK